MKHNTWNRSVQTKEHQNVSAAFQIISVQTRQLLSIRALFRQPLNDTVYN